MANIDRASGFTPVQHLDGSPWNGRTRKYAVASSYGTRVDVGDVVKLAGSADSTGRYPTVELCNSTDPMVGVVVSCDVYPDDLSRVGIPLSTGGYVNVCDDPYVIFVAQIDGAIAADDIGYNTKTAVVAGTDANGRSKSELDYDEIGATATLQWKLIGLQDTPDNELGANAKVLCLPNNHSFKGHTGTTGL